MIKVKIVAVGKVKEKYFSQAIDEYEKRLSRFCNFSIKEVKEENFEKVNPSVILEIKKIEGERIKKELEGFVFVMAIEGKQLSSEELSQKIVNLKNAGTSTITFVIGGSYGVCDSIKNLAKEKISFSRMTFPHTLFRLLLTEQLYRAFTIENGVSYHK